MEKTISELKTSGLELRLTEEKLFLATSVAQETIALRSINGIAVVDLVDEYNSKLTAFKKEKSGGKFILILGIVFCVVSVFAFLSGANTDNSEATNGAAATMGFGIFLVIISLLKGKKLTEPTLMSVLKINTNGGTRDFEFDKKGVFSGNVAEFVARIEDTLTAFHKQ
jgi:hypothetical protein